MKPCPWCGRSFDPRKGGGIPQRHCSRSCSGRANYQKNREKVAARGRERRKKLGHLLNQRTRELYKMKSPAQKAAMMLWARAYYRANKEKIRKRTREWFRRYYRDPVNRKKMRERARRLYNDSSSGARGKKIARDRKYLAENREKIRARHRELRRKNPDKSRAASRAYYCAHKAELIAYQRARKRERRIATMLLVCARLKKGKSHGV